MNNELDQKKSAERIHVYGCSSCGEDHEDIPVQYWSDKTIFICPTTGSEVNVYFVDD